MQIYSPSENTSYYVINEVTPSAEGAKRVAPEEAAQFNKGNHGVFFALQKFQDDRRIKTKLTQIRTVALDLDNGTKEELESLIDTSPLLPSLVVETKNGFHVYFYIRPIMVTEHTRNAILAEFNVVMAHILPHFQYRDDRTGNLLLRNNKAVGADNNAKDVCRVLRVPGYEHRKQVNEPFTITVSAETNCLYTFDELKNNFALIEERTENGAFESEITPNYNIFWDDLISRPVRDCLSVLSGRTCVGGDKFTFSQNSNKTTQIIANKKPTSCFIDLENKIGSSDKGGPTIIQWLQWYGHTYAQIAHIAKDTLKIEASKPTNYKLMLQLTKNKELIAYKGEVFIYDKKEHIWKHQEDSFVRKIIHKICLDNRIDPTNGKVTDIHNLALDHFFEKDIHFNVNKDILTFKNAVLDISNPLKPKVLPFSPQYYSTILLPYEYKPQQKSPIWNKFLNEVLPDNESQRLVQEMFGYCLTTSTVHHVAFFLDGGGRNGKSTFMEVLAKTLGEENVSSVSFHSLSNRFGLQDMENKLINYDPEISSEHIANTSIFKAIVGGDPVEIERKFKNSYRARFFCKLIYAANELPSIRDRSHGFFSRLIIIPFEQTFSEEKGNIDRNIGMKLSKEMSGVFNWAFTGLQRLTKESSFTKPVKSKLRLDEYKLENNSLLQFVEELCVFDLHGKVTSRRFFSEYVQFCKESNLRAFSIKKVGIELAKLENIQRKYMSNVATYVGITLRDADMY